MSEVKYIMESVKIGRIMVVGEPIPDEDAIAFLEDEVLSVY
jgi:hypothetical protein